MEILEICLWREVIEEVFCFGFRWMGVGPIIRDFMVVWDWVLVGVGFGWMLRI